MRAIIAFHSIDNSGGVLSFPPGLLARLLESLARAAVPVVDLDCLIANPRRRAVTLTFDDGMQSVYDAALPLLKAHGVPSHLFLTTSAVGGCNRWPSQPASTPVFDMLDWDQLEKLQTSGVRIECHTHSHPDLRTLNEPAALEECERADQLIEDRLGRRPRYFAWPFGHVNRALLPVLTARYRGLLTTAMRGLREGDPATALPRLDAYYLRHPWLVDHPGHPATGGWLSLRRTLRRWRGGY